MILCSPPVSITPLFPLIFFFVWEFLNMHKNVVNNVVNPFVTLTWLPHSTATLFHLLSLLFSLLGHFIYLS